MVVRGANVMLGYWNRPTETAATVRDGWMHTGDMARMDERGYLFIIDRLKDMIITGGENVFSAEVENALPAIRRRRLGGHRRARREVGGTRPRGHRVAPRR
ncbi:hypothetical protein MSAS_00020 [Mycobacterium saskatchewanense]|nr:hypothetical protein MSAS_00020 [Mycobacterium saskatchewanense]